MAATQPALVLAVLVFAGCSHAGSSLLPQAGDPTARPVRIAPIHFTIKIPKRPQRRSHYISPAATSISIKVYNAAHTTLLSAVVRDLTASSPGCVGTPASTECTFDIDVRPGPDTFDVTTYDQTGGTGHPLSALVDYPFTVKSGKANAIPLTLGGLAASFKLAPSNALQTSYSTASGLSIVGTKPQSLTIVALDAKGYTIVGADAPTPVVDATPASTTLAAPQPASPNVWTLTSTYTNAANPTTPNNVTLSITATPVPGSGGSTLHQAIPLALYDPWIYVVDLTARRVFEFDEAGNSKTTVTAFLGINATYDATYVPATNWVYVSDKTVSVMRVYDVLGNAVTPGATMPFPNLSTPAQSAFDSHDGLLYVANYGGNTITAYDARGNQETAPAFNLGGTFLNGPFAIAYDPNNNFIYIANYTGSTAAAYNEQGVQETDQVSTFKNLA